MKVKATVKLRVKGQIKVIKKSFKAHSGAEQWILKMAKNKAFIGGYSPTLSMGQSE
jgi:hypothetical protein